MSQVVTTAPIKLPNGFVMPAAVVWREDTGAIFAYYRNYKNYLDTNLTVRGFVSSEGVVTLVRK